ADCGMEGRVGALNVGSARLAREVADGFPRKGPAKRRFVAGCMGPTNKTAGMSPQVNDPGFRAITFDALREAYKEQAEALLDGGVDLLMVEAVFVTLNAKPALFALEHIKQWRGPDF